MSHPSETLLTEVEIQGRVHQLAKEFLLSVREEQLDDEEIVAIGVMTGAIIFMADLIRKLGDEGFKPLMDTMVVSSYGDKTTSNEDPTVVYEPKHELHNKHLVVVEDILDTLWTIQKIVELLRKYEPASITIMALLAKNGAAEVPMPEGLRQIHVGFEIPAHFWVHGYGIDTEEMYRWLRHIEVVLQGASAEEVERYLKNQKQR